VKVFHIPAFLVEGPAPELVVVVLDELASGARAELGTTGIRDFGASSKSGT
jgi:hypothetical protein